MKANPVASKIAIVVVVLGGFIAYQKFSTNTVEHSQVVSVEEGASNVPGDAQLAEETQISGEQASQVATVQSGASNESANNNMGADNGGGVTFLNTSTVEVIDMSVEGDTNNDTLNALLASMKDLERKYDEAKNDQVELINSNKDLQRSLNKKTKENEKLSDKVGELFGEVVKVKSNLEKIKNTKQEVIYRDNPQSEKSEFVQTGEVPVSVDSGRPRLKSPNFEQNRRQSQSHDHEREMLENPGLHRFVDDNTYSWVTPMDAVSTVDENGNQILDLPEFAERTIDNYTEESRDPRLDLPPEEQFVPFATIPRGATFLNAVAFTALIGRIPIEDKVVDPYQFKALISGENLASNGIYLEGLSGVVVGGTARGDYTMRCVSGDIEYITFTFQDGTISTYPDESTGGPIGSISDIHGVPCVSGDYISNGGSYLLQRLGLDVVNAGAEAYAASQTSVDKDLGTTTVTGDVGEYAASKAIVGGAETGTDYLEQRQQSAFDAIFVKPGKKLTIHIDKQIAIDHKNFGRKTNYKGVNDNATFSYTGF